MLESDTCISNVQARTNKPTLRICNVRQNLPTTRTCLTALKIRAGNALYKARFSLGTLFVILLYVGLGPLSAMLAMVTKVLWDIASSPGEGEQDGGKDQTPDRPEGSTKGILKPSPPPMLPKDRPPPAYNSDGMDSTQSEESDPSSEEDENDQPSLQGPIFARHQVRRAYDSLPIPSTASKELQRKINQLRWRRTGQKGENATATSEECEGLLYLADTEQEMGGKLMVKAKVGGVPAQLELDSGSAITIISKEIFSRIDKSLVEKMDSPGLSYRDFNDNPIPAIGIYKVPLTLDDKVWFYHSVLVVDKPGEAHPCLLGLDVIRGKRFSVVNDNARIFLSVRVGERERKITLHDSGDAYIAGSVTIEAGEVMPVKVTMNRLINKVQVDSSLYGMAVIGKSIATEDSGLLFPKEGLYVMGDDATIEVPVVNRTLGPITLQEGERVLQVERVAPGTTVQSTGGDRQVVTKSGKLKHTAFQAAEQLEKILSLKEKMPTVTRTSREQPGQEVFQIDLRPTGLLPDEKALDQALSTVHLTRNGTLHVSVSGHVPYTRRGICHVLNQVLKSKPKRGQITLDISKCPDLGKLLEECYYIVAAGTPVKLPKLTLVTKHTANRQKSHATRTNVVKAEDNTQSDSPPFSEDDLCEPIFKQMPQPVNKNPDFWEELVSGAPRALQGKLLHLLTEKHRSVFPKNTVDFGRCTLPDSEFPIKLTTEEAFSCRPYPLNNVYAREVEETMDQMVSAGLMIEETSSYGSGVFVRPRGDSSGAGNHRIRIIHDLRKLNSFTIRDVYPLPDIRSLLQSLHGKRFFGLIDLKDSYQSLVIKPEDRKKAAVVTAKRVLVPTRMSYGFTNAPAHFSRTIARVVRMVSAEPGAGLTNYMDDIILYSNTPEGLVNVLDKCLEELNKAGFKVNLQKLNIFKRKLKLLGFVFTEGGIMSDPAKVETIMKLDPPTTVRQMQRFLGAVNYHSDFISNFSKITEPLLTYVTKETKDGFKLSKDALTAFQAVKEALARPVKLNLIDNSRPVYLESDASGTAFGAVAYQVAMYDLSCVDRLKQAQLELEGKQGSDIDQEIKEAIRTYVETGKPPRPKGTPDPIGHKEQPESPFLNSAIKSRSLNGIYFSIEVNFFYSRRFSEVQRRSWSSLAKELVCILVTVERKCDLLLLGSDLIILSDAKSAIYLYQQAGGHALMSRYLSRLNAYPFKILVRHKDGKNLLLADMISRAWILNPFLDSEFQTVPHTEGILVQSPFRPGEVVTPGKILELLQAGGNNIVRRSSDPNITRHTQTDKGPGGMEDELTVDWVREEGPQTNTTRATQTGTRQGTPNKKTDMPPNSLSRVHKIRMSVKSEVDKLTNLEAYLEAQARDFPEIRDRILTSDEAGPLKIENGLIMTLQKGRWLRYTPPSLQRLVLLKAHLQGHLGSKRMAKIISATDYWPNIPKDCLDFTSTCLSCLFIRPPREGEQQLGAAVPTHPFEMWQIDLVSGLPSKKGFNFFMSVIDKFTKFCVVVPLRTDEAAHIADALEQRVFSILGTPKYLISDGATNLNKSKVFQTLARFYGIELKVRVPYSSRSLGAVERVHRSILDCFRSFQDQFQMSWVEALPCVNIVYNHTPHSATGYSPMELTFGDKANLWSWTTELIGGSRWAGPSAFAKDHKEEMDHIRASAQKLQAEYTQKMKDRFEGKNKEIPPASFCLALDKSPPKPTEKLKLRPKFTGPFFIHDVLDSVVLAESCRTGKLGYIHKQFLRLIPEKDVQKYESLPAICKLKMGGGHTYKEWETLLHQGKLLQEIDRQVDGTEYGTENTSYGTKDLPDLAQDENCEKTTALPQMGGGKETEPDPEDTEIEEDAEPTPGPSGIPYATTRQHTMGRKTVTFEEPRRSAREIKLPSRFRD